MLLGAGQTLHAACNNSRLRTPRTGAEHWGLAIQSLRQRRSRRLALTIPIRVFGIDYKGTDFSEDSTTVVVNWHGTKIRLTRQLLPDQEIRLFSHATYKDALFRVVSQVPGLEDCYTFWGLECLEPEREIWGIAFSDFRPEGWPHLRAMAECPVCSTRELLHVDKRLMGAFRSQKGIPHGCLICRSTSLWKLVGLENPLRKPSSC